MPSLTNPDLWSDLSGLGSSEANHSDARAALLKVNAEMFVAAPARDRESIETFEALVLGFLPRTGAATLRELARILAPCPDTPASILDYLARHSSDAEGIVPQRARPPSPALERKQLATPEGRLHLASQPDLAPAIVHKLIVLRESAVEDALAGNPAFAPGHPSFADLLQRARCRSALAHILLERADLAAGDEASLYLAADAGRRLAIRERVAGLLSHRRVVLSFALSEQDIAGLVAAGVRGDVPHLESLLTEVFSFPAAEWRLLEIGRHRLLALALKALGLERREAIRIFLNLHPALAYPLSAIKDLVREMQDVSAPVALILVEAILDVKTLSGETL